MVRPGRRPVSVLTVAMACLLAGVLAGSRPLPVQGTGAPKPGYTVMPAGWNLISSATAVSLDVPSAGPSLYTLQPGDASYQTLNWQQLQAGYGYWALFRENTAVHLPPSSQESYSVDVPAGQWVMVGNPSTSGSARLTGVDQAFIYSALSGYRADTLIPVGYGAFVLSNRGGRITVSAGPADSPEVDYPACCRIGSGDYGGNAQIEILDDSPFALFYGVRAVAATGAFPLATPNNYAYGAIAACTACDEYTSPPAACRSSASMRTVDVAPGEYLIRLTTDGPRVPDIILQVTLEPNTHYYFCRWIGTGRT